MQFNTDADIEPRRKQAQNYNILLKDIPIKQLVEAESIEGIATAVKKIFAQIKKNKNKSKYPNERAVDLGQCIANDFDEQLKKVISSTPLMRIDYNEYMNFQKDLQGL